MDTKEIPRIILLLQKSDDGNISAISELKEIVKNVDAAKLVKICREALNNTTKSKHMSGSNSSHGSVNPGNNINSVPEYRRVPNIPRVGRFSNRCSVCDRPAIPGDSLCFTHNN